ncbi:putative membrane protein YdjX (TVP38/TMEM64 family) [Nakamurella sp. UYEF19]|uniref:TVP38/TMEM64 family protein n=1 Tax=Nakamurella sp. UYEF19 TaxID=1756392 RepID=UPI0033920E22
MADPAVRADPENSHRPAWDDGPMRMRQRVIWQATGLVLLMAAIVIVALTVGLPDLDGLRADLARMGWWAGVVFAGLYAAATLSPLPKTVLTLAAGALFGVPIGLLLVVVGANIGAIAGFGIGRVLGRETVRRIVGVRFERFDALLERRGFFAILTARLIPVVPFTAVNYLAGLTVVRLRDFVAGTVLGMIPATTAYVTVGAYGAEPGSWPFLAAVGALVLLTVVGVVMARRRRRPAADTVPDGLDRPPVIRASDRVSSTAESR